MKKLTRKFNLKSKGFWIIGIALCVLPAALLVVYGIYVKASISERIEQLKSSRSSQFFASYPSVYPGQIWKKSELTSLLVEQGFQEVYKSDDLIPLQFFWSKPSPSSIEIYRGAFNESGKVLDRLLVKVFFTPEADDFLKVSEIKVSESGAPLPYFEFPPKRIGAYYAGRLRTQRPIPLSEIPVSVRHAVMAIEDVTFLEHSGVSFRSILRALFKDIRTLRFAEGGSTITQQLMKNLFFSKEKALIRKLKEALYALTTEIFYSKEDILEAYLNEVYLGQWSGHEIHGVSEGAFFYFSRPVSEITLAQSATLAAIVQVPNALDPTRHPEKAIKRRNLVLKKMFEAGLILEGEYTLASSEPMGVSGIHQSLQDVGYFLDLVLQELPEHIKTRLDTDALSILTPLNPQLQALSSRLIKSNLDRIETQFPTVKKKKAKGLNLQSSLITVDVKNCTIVALQGGSSYQKTQFNRVLDGKRQPGSLFKPFVYLAGFANPSPDKPITAVTEIEGEPFEWKYDKQVWKPKNYEKEYPAKVLARVALAESLNVPTARLAQKIGIPQITKLIVDSGIKSTIPDFPSISLGSAEVTPLELAEAYTTLANLGKGCSLRPYLEVYDENKNRIFENKQEMQDRLPLIPTFLTVEMMKDTFRFGTAKSAQASGMSFENFSGKTGTTNEYKDAWFVGFSPTLLTLVWVGYDEEEKVGLTGAAAALPLWTDFTNKSKSLFGLEDYIAPEGTIGVELDPETNMVATDKCPKKDKVFFVSGTEPTAKCSLH